MRFSLRLNNDLTLRDYVAVAQAAEAAGFDQIWVSNDLFLRSAPVILQTIAQATQRIEVGAGILNPYTLHPAEIAMLAATLDEATGNRFNLGLAAGAGEFLKWVGIAAAQPLAAMRESIVAIRREQEAYLRFDAPRVTPIYIGAMGPKMLALTGELADGALPLLFPPEHYFGVLPYLQAGAVQRAPELAALDLAVCIWVSLSEDRAAARHVLAAKIAYYGHALSPLILARLGVTQADFRPIEQAMMVERDITRAVSMVDERMLRIGIVGGVHDVIERLEPLVAAGARHLSFGPPLGPDQLEAVRLLGQVIQHFQ
jgi:5,10-methylenetetrahydromethanopterin reductase